MKIFRLLALTAILITSVSYGDEEEITDSGWNWTGDEPALEEGIVSETEPEIYTNIAARAESSSGGMEELARGLENDPKRIFDYVHDNIRYVPYFGCKKGAQLTLLERSGNDFDQAALLVSLLRSAGHNVTYQFGRANLPYSQTNHVDWQHWWNLTKPNTNWGITKGFLGFFMNTRGFPTFYGPTNNLLTIHRVWVKLNWEGTNYYLDPAFKVSEPISGIDLTAGMQLDTNALLTAAGGTNTTNYVQSLNETGLRNKLRDYTVNLLGYLQSNYPNASVEEIIGGHRIVSSQDQPLNQSMAFNIESTIYEWNNIPTEYMSTFNVRLDGTNYFFYMPDLNGDKISLTFNSSGLAQLWRENTNVLQKQTSSGTTIPVAFEVTHPHGGWDTNNNVLINATNHSETVTNFYRRTSATNVLVYGFDPSPEWLRKRQEQLDFYRKIGLSDTSREVKTETLNIMALSWMVQARILADILAGQNQIQTTLHHRFGRIAHEVGLYIDIYQSLTSPFPVNSYDDEDKGRSRHVFEYNAYTLSAAEHAVIQQSQSAGTSAASTIKMLQVANANGQKIFLARNNNWTTGPNVRSQLTNYTLATLDAHINANRPILLPQNGSNFVAGAGTWKGHGAVIRSPSFMLMRISGGYNGGYSADSDDSPESGHVSGENSSQPGYFKPTDDSIKAGDPVSMASGAFLVSSTDLSLGQREPRGLNFSRHYTPTRRNHNLVAMANGWVHNYYLTASRVSAPLPGLGTTTPAQMAPILVAIKSGFALYSTNLNPKAWATAALVSKWGLDQLIDNGVSISLGEDSLQFINQPDDTYTPPVNCTMTLTENGSGYNLAERHGRTFKFSSTRLTNIVDQYNKSLSIAYGTNNHVQTVTDWKSRTLTFSYTGNPQRLSSVADSTGRTISFGYVTNAGQLDLAWVADLEGKTNSYLYDTNHLLLATKDALNRTVVTNIYDTQGRVITQYTEGDTNKIWQYYWSGYVNVEQDPAGSRRRFFYDSKQRATAIQDALGNISRTVYDGQDHKTQTVSPLNETNLFTFDGQHNLLMSIDPLGYTNRFVYAADNTLSYSVDPRGNSNTFGYNAKFQLTGSTNGAGNWTTFAYDSGDGSLLAQVDASGSTTYGYDSYGHLNSVVYPGSLGSQGYSNNALGDVVTHTNARGFATSFEYNKRRQLTNTIAPTNVSSKIVYDAIGNVLSTTDSRNFSSTNVWSATRKLLSTALPTTPQGVPLTTNIYDVRDWLKQTKNPLLQSTLYTNDAAGRFISLTDPLLRTTKFGYDADGRKTATTNAALEVTRQAWNGRGEMTSVTDPTNRIVQNQYDAAGNRVTLTNRNGKVWQFQFDGANRLTNTITPLNRQTWLIFNSRGLLDKTREPSGEWMTNAYDAKGRITNRSDSIGTIGHQYDGNNNRTAIIEGSKSNVWVWDAYDRVSRYTDSEGNLIEYNYDANGNLTNLVYPGGKNVKYFYDGLNRLTNVTDWASRQTSLEYDLAGNLKSIVRPNGTVRETSYDAARQLTNIIERMGIGVPIAHFKFNWNSASRIDWEFVAPLPHTYTSPTRTMTYDDDNRIATFNGNNVAYDLDGNLTNAPMTNATLVGYVYDARNRLLTAGGLNYGYNPSGNRVSITNGADVTRFVINPNSSLSQVLIRIRPDNSKTFYVYGPGLLYEVNETSGGTETSVLTYHFDSRGSTVALSGTNGVVTDRIEYSAYGMTGYRSGTNDTPFLYNGRYGVMTDSNGLLCMRARYYNPYLCRFLNSDPIGFSGGLNFYAFADGNPISLLDPFGLISMAEISGVWDQFKHIITTGDTWWQRPLYTGDSNPSPDVLDAGTTAAGEYVHDHGAVRGFFVGSGLAGKLSKGHYMPGYALAGELNWTIEGGFGGQLSLGGGLQMRGKTHLLGLGTKPFVSEQFGLAGTYSWNETSGGFLSGKFGGALYGGQANRRGGYAFQVESSNNAEFGFTYLNFGIGVIVDPERFVAAFSPSVPGGPQTTSSGLK